MKGFTSQFWNKNSVHCLWCLANAFLLVWEKPLLMKLINFCFSVFCICMCVCVHIFSLRLQDVCVRNWLGWGIAWLLAWWEASGMWQALLEMEVTSGTIIISRPDFLGWLVWNPLRDIQEDNACLCFAIAGIFYFLFFFVYPFPIKCLSHCQAALFLWYAECFEGRIPQLPIFPKHGNVVRRESWFLSSDITQYEKETLGLQGRSSGTRFLKCSYEVYSSVAILVSPLCTVWE